VRNVRSEDLFNAVEKSLAVEVIVDVPARRLGFVFAEQNGFEDDECLSSYFPPRVLNEPTQHIYFLIDDLVVGYDNVSEQSGKNFGGVDPDSGRGVVES